MHRARAPVVGALLGLLGAARSFAPGEAHAQSVPKATPLDESGAPREAPATPEKPTAAGAAPRADVPARDEPEVRFDAKTHFTLSWVRMPGAEECISAKQLSRAVENRLHRPAFGAPSETDVAIEGFIERTDQEAFHAVVTISDSRGKLLGKRELDGAVCRDMDPALALAVALMIDPDAAFAPSAPAAPAPAPARQAAKPSPRPVTQAPASPAVTGDVSAGIAFAFGNLPGTSEGAWVLGAVKPRHFFPIELGAHLFLDRTFDKGAGAKAAFSRSGLDAALCPLGIRVLLLELGACAGVQAGTISAAGVTPDGLATQREAFLDVTAKGHLDVIFLRRFALRVMPSLGIPTIRDSFDYRHRDGTLDRIFRVGPVYGEVAVGFGVKLP